MKKSTIDIAPAFIIIMGGLLIFAFFGGNSESIALSESKINGRTVSLSVPSEKLENTPEWQAGKAELPLSVNEAIRIGIESFHRKYPNRGEPFLQSVSIRSFSSSRFGTRRYYSVQLLPVVDGEPNYREFPYEVLVLMDGTVVEPS